MPVMTCFWTENDFSGTLFPVALVWNLCLLASQCGISIGETCLSFCKMQRLPTQKEIYYWSIKRDKSFLHFSFSFMPPNADHPDRCQPGITTFGYSVHDSIRRCSTGPGLNESGNRDKSSSWVRPRLVAAGQRPEAAGTYDSKSIKIAN